MCTPAGAVKNSLGSFLDFRNFKRFSLLVVSFCHGVPAWALSSRSMPYSSSMPFLSKVRSTKATKLSL
ncbi:MAG: hypothetical protein A4E30_01380 [Methanomassiliicoccales archaeon PtaB.Bin215]|nr:MAG: hypothetical protein A4E30_01380 [Methanomassiliicoccales archaeon PtaB.Bin215]